MSSTRDNIPASAAAWLEGLGISLRHSTALAGDVSQRQYYRLDLAERFDPAGQGTGPSTPTAILALYPPALVAGCRQFVTTTELLSSVDVRVPQIAASDCEGGLMLIEDLGPKTLYDLGKGWSSLGPYLDSAIRYTDRLQEIPMAEVEALSPSLNGELLHRELLRTWELFLGRPPVSGSAKTGDLLLATLEKLSAALDQAPPEICHRDYMARNLIPVSETGALAVIDHQDLKVGPRGYDLASLLNDSLFASRELEREILERRFSDSSDRLNYSRSAAQRCLKIIGTFVGSSRHLELVAPALERAADHLAVLPEAQALPRSLLARWREPGFAAAQLDRNPPRRNSRLAGRNSD